MKMSVEHKLRIFQIPVVILNTKWKDCISRKNLFYLHEKILRTRNCCRNFVKKLLFEKGKENM